MIRLAPRTSRYPAGGAASGLGGVSGAAGGEGTAQSRAVLHQMSTAVCTYFQACCTTAAFPATNIAGCESQYETNYAQLSAGVADGSLTVNQTKLSACTAAAHGACTLDGSNALNDDCVGGVVGTKAAGASCRWTLECAPTSPPQVCWKKSTAGATQEPATGVCTPTTVGQQDQSCTGTTQDAPMASLVYTVAAPASSVECSSAAHLECLVAGTDATCQAERGEGTPCADSRFCAQGFFCTMVPGVCTAFKAVGQACQSDYECQTSACVASKCSANPASSNTCQSFFHT